VVLDVLRALGRRWYVVIAGLVLTAAMTLGAYQLSPPEHNARALVLLLPPKSDLGKGGNPFLQLSGLEQPASILTGYFSSEPARAEVEKLSPNAQFTVAIDSSTRGPVILVDVTDDTAAATMKVLEYLLGRIPEELTSLQQKVGARQATTIRSMPLVVDRQPKADTSGTLRAMIAALVLGLVATGVTAYSIDGLVQRRRVSKRSARVAPAVVGPDTNIKPLAPVPLARRVRRES
jgi:hypothetical protein